MIERTSPPAARARAASSRRPAGVMTNWSAARTSSAPMPDRAAGAAAARSRSRRSRSAAAACSGRSAPIVSQPSVDATSVVLVSAVRSTLQYPGLHSSPTSA